MDNCIEIYKKRWEIIERETLSSIRRQLMQGVYFNTQEVDKDFRKSCDEWFSGKLGPSVWYKELRETEPGKAQAFQMCVDCMHLQHVNAKPPTKVLAYVTTISAMPIMLILLNHYTEWTWPGKAVLSVVLTVLIWTIWQGRHLARSRAYEEQVVTHYRKQLVEMGKQIENTLQ